MKFSTILPTLFLFPYTSAFPSYASLEGNPEKRQEQFDPVRQKIDVTGIHIFKPPGPGDLRGPCPGLNALANHGYIQRNGVTTFIEIFAAAQQIYGIGEIIALSLSYATPVSSLLFGCSTH